LSKAEASKKCINIVGRTPAEIKVRKMKNWGNCKQNGIITLNLNLAKKPPICLEYVLIHELCHLIEFNHGKKFKKLMDKFCPNWKKIKKVLNE
jgi:predicted metal-dependent hydrolase